MGLRPLSQRTGALKRGLAKKATATTTNWFLAFTSSTRPTEFMSSGLGSLPRSTPILLERFGYSEHDPTLVKSRAFWTLGSKPQR